MKEKLRTKSTRVFPCVSFTLVSQSGLEYKESGVRFISMVSVNTVLQFAWLFFC